MKSSKILVNTKNKSYPLYFGDGILKLTDFFIKKNLPGVKKICVITDKKLPSLLISKLGKSLKKYDLKIYKLASEEKTKSFKYANNLIENLLRYNLNRNDCVIAFGGGIIGDLSSFVASLTKRGVRFINIPTTLLSQVDASIGGKTAVNSIQGKNLIGTFYQPDFVIMDMSVLSSLPKREMICGYAEILKHALISNKKFFIWLSKNARNIIEKRDKKILHKAIIESCKIKSKIINKDEKEKNLRMVLNFGHTFGHGFEGAKNFSKKLNHGEAVLLGMMMAAKLSYKKKLLPGKDLVLLKKHYESLNLPMKIKDFFKKNEIEKIIYFLKKDKKNFNKKINLILLKRIGQVTKPNAYNTNVEELRSFLRKNYN